MSLKPVLPALLLCLLLATAAAAQTIDYAYVSSHDYEALNQDVYDAVGRQVWMFSHASVGANILDGMTALHDGDPARYPLVRTEAGLDHAPDAPELGTIYDVDRGNPGWSEKYALFRAAVTGPWGARADFVMDKLCYIDQDADANAYLSMMERLEAATQAAVVYTTIPLTTEEDHDNDLRNAYNETVRAYAAANGKLLFDIADLEAHDALGNEHAYKGGRQKLYSGWSDDGGHLDGRGQAWLARGWYVMAAGQVRSVTLPGTKWTISRLAPAP